MTMIRSIATRVSLAVGLLLAGSALNAAPVTINYWLWDSNQQPAYQAAADAFQKQNPDIKIQITQSGWGDYWTGLQTSLVAGTAPDVFTDHLAMYGDFASKNQLVDLQSYVTRDKVDTTVYMNGLADLWTKNGKRYGLPKDWDTITIVYNKDALKEAGITEAEANALTWNPKDGGSFEKFIAKLSVDKNGKNGLDPKFDPANVVRYGMALNHYDDRGQAQFSPFAVSNGWMYTSGTFKADYKFDDPKFIETIEWLVKVTKKGWMADYAATQNGSNPLFVAKKAATTLDGSWMIGFYSTNAGFPTGFAKLPAGPAGVKSMINGLADSITVGSQHKEEAWKWVKFLGSEEAQKIIGSYGVVFPAIKSGVDAALAAYKAKGLVVSAFTDESLTPGQTFLYPVVDNGVKISEIMNATFDKIFTYKATPKDALTDANKKILALFKK
jgi:multiple sugar transport system substrate-binding protein